MILIQSVMKRRKNTYVSLSDTLEAVHCLMIRRIYLISPYAPFF